jgi:hypothetical protein
MATLVQPCGNRYDDRNMDGTLRYKSIVLDALKEKP